jgi:hypothetical protein
MLPIIYENRYTVSLMLASVRCLAGGDSMMRSATELQKEMVVTAVYIPLLARRMRRTLRFSVKTGGQNGHYCGCRDGHYDEYSKKAVLLPMSSLGKEKIGGGRDIAQERMYRHP